MWNGIGGVRGGREQGTHRTRASVDVPARRAWRTGAGCLMVDPAAAGSNLGPPACPVGTRMVAKIPCQHQNHRMSFICILILRICVFVSNIPKYQLPMPKKDTFKFYNA